LFSYFANPEFGVEFSIEDQQNQPATRLESKVDDIEILQSREHTDSYAVSALFNDRIVHRFYFLDLSNRCR
jgi:hypothetical protein